MSVTALAHVNGPTRIPRPYPFDLRSLNRLIGRGGRIADTHDPERYVALFRRLIRHFGDHLRYGFMLPVNLILDGVVDHPLYHEPRVPQLTPMALFQEQHALWRARAALAVRGTSRQEIAMSEKLVTLCGDFGVEMIILTPKMIDGDYLHSDEFADRLNDALFFHSNLPPQPPTSPYPPLPRRRGLKRCFSFRPLKLSKEVQPTKTRGWLCKFARCYFPIPF